MKFQQDPYAYGECDVCDTPLQEQRIKQDFWIRGELVVVDNVMAGVCPQCGAKVMAGVCPQCGAKVVPAAVGQQLAVLLSNTEHFATAPRMSVPVVVLDD